MGQQDPAPVNLVSGSAGWRRGLGGMLNPLAKTEEDSLRAPLSAVTPRSSWTGEDAVGTHCSYPLLLPGQAPWRRTWSGEPGLYPDGRVREADDDRLSYDGHPRVGCGRPSLIDRVWGSGESVAAGEIEGFNLKV